MSLSAFDMRDKTVLITGSTQGMGLAIARGFHAVGARTVISSNLQTDVDRAVAELKADGVDVEGIVCDLWDAESIATLAERAESQFGPVDTLIAHGGGFMTGGPLTEVSRADFEKILLTGPMNTLDLVRGFLPRMAENGGGSIVVTSSVAAFQANPFLGAYGAAKATLNSLVRSIATEWGPMNIRANAIAPGIVRTAFSQPIWGSRDGEQALASKIPLGRIAEPEEIVGAMLLLGSPAGSYITGTTLVIDGGRSIS
ncbi:SDR family NAD(P)-dependent oxidoreductase [Streptomyces sp. 3214.6]|uniref:SDR family NAD(P)-dependent oxidoreductase n=1 Tax=Streptomyces sp. 3214.6 TaxID=1882757 RepID=UPI000909DF4E|nr:SDR family oxidoreductase [Streptomyces sp. 3214.6]SHH29585.1 dehydrogenase/reductase SDR family member 4 [Streptomyces sp. 3214.6]